MTDSPNSNTNWPASTCDERIRSVAVEAGIPPEALDLDGAPVTDWHNVLTEAANRGNVADLVAIAIDEYPTRVRCSARACEA